MSQDRRTQRQENVAGVDLSAIRNRNERRVRERMEMLLSEYTDFEADVLAIQDIYALALNLLPARYTQQFSIVLKEPVDDAAVENAVRAAIEKVRTNPTGRSEYGETS